MRASARKTSPRSDRPASVVYLVGATDTGKTTWLLRQLAALKPRRLVVWDTKGEFARKGLARPVSSLCELRELLKDNAAGWFAYQPHAMGVFDVFCWMVYCWGRCDLVVEELAEVTHPGKAPQWWGNAIRRGRDRGLRVWATSQRPAEADKTIYGNFTRLQVHQLMRLKDRREVAGELGVGQSEVDAVRGFAWLAVDRAGRVTRSQ